MTQQIFSREYVENEARNIFNDIPVKIRVWHEADRDALFIAVTGENKEGKGVPCISSVMSGIEMLQAVNPIDILRYRLHRMHSLLKSHIEG
jgi:hypothetical protein